MKAQRMSRGIVYRLGYPGLYILTKILFIDYCNGFCKIHAFFDKSDVIRISASGRSTPPKDDDDDDKKMITMMVMVTEQLPLPCHPFTVFFLTFFHAF
jgi:hypothetical protein